MFGKMRKNVLLLAALLVLVAVLIKPAQVQAETSIIPKESIPGTVSITLKDIDSDTPAAGAKIIAKKVGQIIVENGGDYFFAPVEELAESGISFEDIKSTTLAAELAGYISDNNVQLISQESVVGTDGFVSFSDLPIGLWLFENSEAADGFELFNPFIVTVPYWNEETELYEYEVDATPKVAVQKTPTTPTPSITITPSIGTPTPSTVTPSTATPSTATPTATATPTPVRDYSRLPQTGQLWWPVPVLALAGAALVLVGWFRRRSN